MKDVLTVVTGSPFEVELGASPTTGYTWELASPPVGVRVLWSDFDQPPDAAIGDGGKQIFRLQADSGGRFELRFDLKRRWETTPIQTRVIEVEAT